MKQSTYVYNTVLKNLLVNALLQSEVLCSPYASIVEMTEKNITFELNVQRKKYLLKELGYYYKKDQDLLHVWTETVEEKTLLIQRLMIFVKWS